MTSSRVTRRGALTAPRLVSRPARTRPSELVGALVTIHTLVPGHPADFKPAPPAQPLAKLQDQSRLALAFHPSVSTPRA